MIQRVFLEILNTALTVSPLILALLLFRQLFRRAPRWIFCMMWGLVALWLIVPFRIESDLSVLPTARPLKAGVLLAQSAEHAGESMISGGSVTAVAEAEPVVPGAIGLSGSALQGAEITGGHVVSAEFQSNFFAQGAEITGNHDLTDIQQSVPLGQPQGANASMQSTSAGNKPAQGAEANIVLMKMLLHIGTVIWMTGVAVLLLYAAFSWLSLRRRTAVSMRLEGNVYECDEVDSPFILGMIFPKIYLPTGLTDAEIDNILAHERSHLRRGDHIWKPLGYVLLAVYWFQPLCWAAYILLCRDIEYACDSRATAGMDRELRAQYCRTLLACSAHRRAVVTCPVAFGEVDVKKRVFSVLQDKKPMMILTVGALLAAAVICVFLMTVPKSDKVQNDPSNIDIAADEGPQLEAIPVEEISEELTYEARREAAEAAMTEWALGQSEPGKKEIGVIEARAEDDLTAGEVLCYSIDYENGPLVTILRKFMTLTEEPEGSPLAYRAESSEEIAYDYIASGDEFQAAYGESEFPAVMDYTANGLGEKLNANAMLSSSLGYRDLFEPASAARSLLHLLNNDGKVKIWEYAYSGMGFREDGAILRIEFLEDGYTRRVRMIQPWKDGIWVPDVTYDPFADASSGGDASVGEVLIERPSSENKLLAEPYTGAVTMGDPTTGSEVSAEYVLTGEPLANSSMMKDAYEVTKEMFGYVIGLPGNPAWINVEEYRFVGEDEMNVYYTDEILHAACELHVNRAEAPIEWRYKMDEKSKETWSGYSGDRQFIDVNMQRSFDGGIAIANWAYDDLQFSIIAQVDPETSDLGPLAKTALHVIANLGKPIQ